MKKISKGKSGADLLAEDPTCSALAAAGLKVASMAWSRPNTPRAFNGSPRHASRSSSPLTLGESNQGLRYIAPGGNRPVRDSLKRSSQLKPTRAKFTTWMELGIVWPPTRLELDQVGLNLIKLRFSPNSSQFFHRLATSANSRHVLLLLLCDYAVVFRQLNGFLQAGSTWAVSFGHLPMQVLVL